MKDILVKDVMIPISNYVTVTKENNLRDVLHACEQKRKAEQGHAHRDAIVVDEDGRFVGKVTMIDIFRSLEPNYRKVRPEHTEQTLTDDFVRKAVRQLNLWLEPVESVCQRGRRTTVADAMHIPEKSEYIQESDTLEKALSLYVMGVHQPLIVKNSETVTGVLRFGDIFEVVHERLLNCNLK
ncbi:MAG: CBS domain-containing protein [Desulfosarcina sp.]|nr:CBS domain-containing protein [Desulfobacterales bacterium]